MPILNTPINEWVADHPVGPDMLWKEGVGHQIKFVRDTLSQLMSMGLSYEDYVKMGVCTVVSTHRSKSIDLPVYSLHRPDLGLRLILRDNFYNWKMSVISEHPITADLQDVFHCHPPREPDYTGDDLRSVYFEGFPPDLVFGYYGESDYRRWSAQIDSDERVYMTIFLILRALGHTRTLRTHTREEHQAQLDARQRT